MQREAKKEIKAEAEMEARNAAAGQPFGTFNARAVESSPRGDGVPRAGVTYESENTHLVAADAAREVVVSLD